MQSLKVFIKYFLKNPSTQETFMYILRGILYNVNVWLLLFGNKSAMNCLLINPARATNSFKGTFIEREQHQFKSAVVVVVV